jgi:hypothetical protein
VHYHEEINDPIGDIWLSITQEEFDLFCVNLKYTRHFASLADLQPIVVTPFASTPPAPIPSPALAEPEAPSTMYSLTIPSHTASAPPVLILTEAKDVLNYVLENVIENEDVTRAFNDEGIDNIISLVKLTDDAINNLEYLDPDSKMGPIGCIKSFIHYVHFYEETNPIGNDWKSITMDHFDQFRVI